MKVAVLPSLRSRTIAPPDRGSIISLREGVELRIASANVMIPNRFCLLSLLLILSAGVAFAQPLAPNDVKALLDQIRAKRAGTPQVQADFQEEKDVHLMNKPISSTARSGSSHRTSSAAK